MHIRTFTLSHFSIFDNLPAGASSCSTTWQTGDGGTVQITRTVIGGDGSVRREMRFRTPSVPGRAGEGGRAGRVRAEPQQPAPPPPRPRGRREGGQAGGRPRQPSRPAPHRENRGEPDGVAGRPGGGRRGPEGREHRPDHLREIWAQSPEPAGRAARPRHHSQARQREPEPPVRLRRERSNSAGRAGRLASSSGNSMVPCPLCDGKFARWARSAGPVQQQYCRSLVEEHASKCTGPAASPTVCCPICTEPYPPALIERHAATCGEGVQV